MLNSNLIVENDHFVSFNKLAIDQKFKKIYLLYVVVHQIDLGTWIFFIIWTVYYYILQIMSFSFLPVRWYVFQYNYLFALHALKTN